MKRQVQTALNNLKKFTKNLTYFVVGAFLVTPGILVYIIITIPAIIYYSIIKSALSYSKYFHPNRNDGYVRMVNLGFETAYAIECLSTISKNRPSRNPIVGRFLIEGTIPFEEVFQKVNDHWINAKTKDGSDFINPELRLFLDSWMGYYYWRPDTKFDLKNHLIHLQVTESTDFDEFTDNFIEHLFGQPFVLKQSPWELYVIHGFKENEEGLKVEVTLLLYRAHHVLGDGASIRLLIINDLLGYSLEKLEKEMVTSFNSKNKTSSLRKSINLVKDFVGLFRDLGCLLTFALWRAKRNTRYHVSPKEKEIRSKQIYQVSPWIPIKMIKSIRSKFDVSFSAVLGSSVAAAIGNSMRNDENFGDNFILAVPRPIPGFATNKMANHITMTAVELPVKLEIDPIDRLLRSDKMFKRCTQSLFSPYIFPFLMKLLSFHISPIASLGFKSTFGFSFSNNWGPSEIITYQGKNKVLEIGAATGTYDGTTGVMLTANSYDNQFRMHAISESSALNRNELKIFMDRVLEEINFLYAVDQV